MAGVFVVPLRGLKLGGGGSGGEFHVKEAGKLVFSRRGVNYGFWYLLGCRQYF